MALTDIDSLLYIVGFRPSFACLGLGVGGTLTESDIVASLNELYCHRKHPHEKSTKRHMNKSRPTNNGKSTQHIIIGRRQIHANFVN